MSCIPIPQNDLLKSGKSQAHMVKLLSSRVKFAKSSSDARLATCSYARIELISIHALRCGALRCGALHVRTRFGVHNFAYVLLRNAWSCVIL